MQKEECGCRERKSQGAPLTMNEGMANSDELKEGPPGGAAGKKRVHPGYSRPPLVRMMRLHESLTEKRYPNCRKIAEEFEVSPKTVQRDVNFMRDMMDLPIEYDKQRFGFYYARPVAGFPSIHIPAQRAGRRGLRYPPSGEHPALPARSSGRAGLVRIRFNAASAGVVQRGAWDPTQEMHELPDGGVELTLRVSSGAQLARWILSWGGHGWVIDPPQLRTRVREMARAILARH